MIRLVSHIIPLKQGTKICSRTGLRCITVTETVTNARSSQVAAVPETHPGKAKDDPRALRIDARRNRANSRATRTGAEILAYENDEDDLLVIVLWNYSKLAECPIEQILYDDLEVQFRDLKLVNV